MCIRDRYITKEHKMEIRELPKPDIRQADDVLIRITAASICACDSEIAAVSYTHLDVYKRQVSEPMRSCLAGMYRQLMDMTLVRS